MHALCLHPFTDDPREVANVVCYEDASIASAEREHVIVRQSLELGLLVEYAYIVARFLQGATDPRSGDVGVEQ